jgi:hypothetical protein
MGLPIPVFQWCTAAMIFVIKVIIPELSWNDATMSQRNKVRLINLWLTLSIINFILISANRHPMNLW